LKLIKFLWSNDFDGGIITASNSADGYPVSNLKHRWHTLHWRSINAANEYIRINLEEAKPIKGLAIKYHNFQVGDTVKIQAYNDAWLDLDYEDTLTITPEKIIRLWDTAKIYQWWQILMETAPAAPATYHQIGRLFLGNTSGLSKTFSAQHSYNLIDPSGIEYSGGGQVSSNPKPKYKQMGYTFKGLTAEDKKTLEEIFENVGVGGDYFFCENVNELLFFYVRNISSWEIVDMKTSEKRYSLTIDMETLR
ncbi:unnamed protein product, partial [marine sediment metagenome]